MTGYTGTDNLEVMAEAVRYNAFLVDLVCRHASGESWVDFGAGIGTFADGLKTLGHDVMCVEPDQRQADAIRSKALRVVANADALPDSSASFVYTLNVLEHIADDVDALREIRRVLVPEGRVLVYVPALPLLFTSMDQKVGHLRRYTATSLRLALEHAGFHVDTCRYADSIGVAATLAYRIVGSKTGELNPATVAFYDRWIFPLSRKLDHVLHGVAGKNVWAVARPA